jgi:hypothetical protein
MACCLMFLAVGAKHQTTSWKRQEQSCRSRSNITQAWCIPTGNSPVARPALLLQRFCFLPRGTTFLSRSDANTLSAQQEGPAAVEPAFRQVALSDADVDAAVIAPLHAGLVVTVDLQHELPAMV